jgi:DNA-binding NtrC family response regulator
MPESFADIVCISSQMQEVMRRLKTAAPSMAPVVISGEAGTGKDLVARAIHGLSPISKGRLIPVNCWGSADRSVKDELFGPETVSGGLSASGSLRLANDGTLFLDEVDALPPSTQPRLLRFLENQKDVGLNVRVIAATKDEALVEKRIRADLRYFLNIFLIRVPPLRERVSDMTDLIKKLLSGINQANGRVVSGVDQAVENRFRAHPWPGNVREMRSVLEYAALVSDGNMIHSRDLPRNFGQFPLAAKSVEAELSGIQFPLGTTVERVEELLILQTLERTNNNKTRTAELLGISLKTLHNKLKNYNAPAT